MCVSHPKFSFFLSIYFPGTCGEKTPLLQFPDIISASMYLWKLKQIKLLRNMIMLPSTFRSSFIKMRVWPHILRLSFQLQVVGARSFLLSPLFCSLFCHLWSFPRYGYADVPEGCVVIREHVPISNLFACLWYNEVDRFTSRDQISFSTVRDKIAAKTNWTVNMFLDCERRNFVVQVIILFILWLFSFKLKHTHLDGGLFKFYPIPLSCTAVHLSLFTLAACRNIIEITSFRRPFLFLLTLHHPHRRCHRHRHHHHHHQLCFMTYQGNCQMNFQEKGL